MKPEADIARIKFPSGTQILSGIMSPEELDRQVWKGCTKLYSFGLCGGLRPGVTVGRTLTASEIHTPNWSHKIQAYGVPWYSSGKFDEANTPSQRARLYQKYGAWAIDDESFSVACVAKARNIPFGILRSVSDAWNDDVSFTSNMLNSDGSANPLAVAKAVLGHPFALAKVWRDYNTSMAALRNARIVQQ